ncbi:MAG TPA: DUF3568 family protein [Rhodocyclaceae bacterium]|nr:DUF3568 family protein [Rhodocyclaceae bacterium]
MGAYIRAIMRTPNSLPTPCKINILVAVRLCICAAILCCFSGCAELALSLVGAGAGAGISHQINGMASRTFNEPLPKVKKATLLALRRMTIRLDKTDEKTSGETLKAVVADLNIQVDIETLSTTMTRVSVVARKNLLQVDAATANEIIVQTERALVKA